MFLEGKEENYFFLIVFFGLSRYRFTQISIVDTH